MGCSQSTSTADKGVHSSNGGPRSHTKHDDPLSNDEINKRIDCIKETRTATFGSMTVRYAYLSQRGYYPDDAEKPNQDAYVVCHDFCGEQTDGFFGVFDGHGRDGDGCAQFSRDHLPELVNKAITRTKIRESEHMQARSRSGDLLPLELTKDQVQKSCLKAHVECNRNMHRSKDLDDSLSGTTSISCYVHGRRNRITVCNVGDSRAIVGHTPNQQVPGNGSSSLQAVPLSRDQTPYRRDERVRIRATGARILSLDQIEGLEPVDEDDEESDLELGEELDEGGDPPRVWSPHGEYPGTAFTRSLGDAIAEELGVFSKPEMLTREITPDDKIIVLASDGVFEFLTNQSVIDICAKFSDPLEACRAVVAESYELWLQYELRTDDITMICMFVDDVGISNRQTFDTVSARDVVVPKATAKVSFPEDTADEQLPTAGLRPVRVNISKAKTEALISMKSKFLSKRIGIDEEDKDLDLSTLYTQKSEEEKSRIAEAIRASIMFKDITDEQREMIFGVMEPIAAKQGDWIIKQGEVGDRYYIVDHGNFEVRIVPEGQEDTEGTGGNVVHVYNGSIENHAHPSFGELALMHSAPRAASIIAQTDGQLWALHRYAFRQILAQQSERKELMRALKRIPVFKNLESEKIKRLAAAMVEEIFEKGETVIEQGSVGDSLFVVSFGSCDIIHKEDGKVLSASLKPNDFFGEEVLVDERRYGATVIALQSTSFFKLDKETLKNIAGNLKLKGKISNDNVL